MSTVTGETAMLLDEPHCDWCGMPFGEGEPWVSGYEDRPTHQRCGRAARRAFNKDRGLDRDLTGPEREREPFTDWPNGSRNL